MIVTELSRVPALPRACLPVLHAASPWECIPSACGGACGMQGRARAKTALEARTEIVLLRAAR